jgi:hypothetical protein
MSMFSSKACVMVLIPIPSFDCVFHGPLPYTHLPQPSSKIKQRELKSKDLDFLGKGKKEHDLILNSAEALVFFSFFVVLRNHLILLCLDFPWRWWPSCKYLLLFLYSSNRWNGLVFSFWKVDTQLQCL